MIASGRTACIVALVGVIALLTPRSATTQTFEVGATAMSLRLTRESGTTATATGAAFGIEGRVRVQSVSLILRYHQGHLTGDSPLIDQDFVEGEAFVVVQPARWISFGVGPHVRAYVEPSGTERWLMWEGRLRLGAALLPAVTGYLEGWRVLGADLNVAEALDSGYGLDGGLEIRLSGAPVGFLLRYRTEHAELGGGTRRETVEQIALGIRLGR